VVVSAGGVGGGVARATLFFAISSSRDNLTGLRRRVDSSISGIGRVGWGGEGRGGVKRGRGEVAENIWGMGDIGGGAFVRFEGVVEGERRPEQGVEKRGERGERMNPLHSPSL
jgi:hypothetical protein